jgi:hypothetical protein
MADTRVENARRLMVTFADSTGLTGSHTPRRYLWTDAHAVCNFLGLAAATGDDRYRRLALDLVDQVHHVLGRHRDDDDRSGWISGLGDAEGERHPTASGLRIGKPLPERRSGEAHDPQAEWDQDGQYYHYLTKWMHALLQTSAATGDDRYLTWAVELAVAAYEGFRARSGPPRLYWKMSIALDRPLVPSSGLHDPLDGLVTALTLRAAGGDPQKLAPLTAHLADLCRNRRWETDDPLGIGGLLFDAGRLAQLPETEPDRLLDEILGAAELGLAAFTRSPALRQSGSLRLAFRELGLSIGLHAVTLMAQLPQPAPTSGRIQRLLTHRKLGISIERFWSEPSQQATPIWQEHDDINTVMLATSLLPAGMLELTFSAR